ncbi:unnamed protein product [Didymodactylos carnosus]|nr:unnamed protein product [Didymodactylos carnosus]CAF4032560.1 unnamed protein product [Didymodactylos carnosus]
MDVILGDPTTGSPKLPDNTDLVTHNYRARLIQDLKYAHQIAREHAEVQKVTQKSHYDKHTTPRTYRKGQLVWVAIPSGPLPGKLSPKWQGPCRIIKQLTPFSFKVQRLKDEIVLGTVNADRQKPFHEKEETHQTSSSKHSNLKPLTSTKHIPPLMSIPATVKPTPQIRTSDRIRKPTVRYIS